MRGAKAGIREISTYQRRFSILFDRPKHRLIVVEDADALGDVAARFVLRELRRKPRSVLALPTGRTPHSMYRSLVRSYREGAVDFSKVTTFNLDEFYGIPPDDPGSFASYMRRELFSQVNLRAENINLLDPMAPDAAAECRDYERAIREAGGIDLAVLGIGGNGHIAFDEPGSSFASRTRLVRLTRRTVEDSRRLFARQSQAPRLALTMGIGTIMEARHILLLASGRAKARILAQALQGPVTTEVPASVLQRPKSVSETH